MRTIIEVILDSEREVLIKFLNSSSLDYEQDINYSILVYDEEELIGTASLANNIMKCFLVNKNHTGENITNLMFSHLVNILMQRDIYHYFVYTKPENINIFESLNMKLITKTHLSALLEGGDNINHVLNNLKQEYNIGDCPKSAIIINANPMTYGHLYLIEEASKKSEELLVFVVSEDLSSFKFEDRFKIIKESVKHLENVLVLPTLNYLVSRVTFPKYFLREDSLIKDEQTLIDVLVYKQYYTEIFNITMRYVGSEPFSKNTNKYNEVMKKYLAKSLTIIKRKAIDDIAISASYVRKLIHENKIDEIKAYVPVPTYNYLISKAGQKVIKEIQSKELSRH
ncbi:MAG: adenylyltransferase/cytidyltransferase family protein [Candidatus Izemoplasma sp.]